MEPIALVRFVAEILAPPRCAICAEAAGGGELVCPRCDRALRTIRPGSAHLILGIDTGRVSWAGAYTGVARDLVAALKFGGRVGLADLAAAAICAHLSPPTGARVVPVPAAPLRLRRRGFDPAEVIAARTAARLGLELVPCLGRRGGPRQVGRRRADRLAAPPRIRVRRPPPPRVLLIDDVLTTGATIGACLAELRAAGSIEVEAAVFARTLGGPGLAA